jgi:hypothetical protein
MKLLSYYLPNDYNANPDFVEYLRL